MDAVSLSSSKFSSKPDSGIRIGFMRFFCGGEPSEVFNRTKHAYISAPFLAWFMPFNSLKSGCVGGFSFCIPGILQWSRLSKINPLIVGSASIDMIDAEVWPLSIHYNPSYAMDWVAGIVEFHSQVSVTIEMSSNLSCASRVPLSVSVGSMFPLKKSGFWVIRKGFSDVFCREKSSVSCYRWVSHSIGVLQSWWSGTLRSVATAPPSRGFYRTSAC